jgi:FkbM family methyltransferase
MRARDRAVEIVSSWRRSSIVNGRTRFFVNDVQRRPGVSCYSLRNGAGTVLIRHSNVEDSFVLKEIFGAVDTYAVPGEVDSALRSAGVSVITDLGANIGLAALKFGRMFPTAQLVCVEADKSNASILEATLALNDLLARTRVLKVAAAASAGTLRFVAGEGGRSHVAAPGEDGANVEAVDIFPVLEGTDLLKIDIEGGEWTILEDDRVGATPIKAICMEYHARLCPGNNASTTATALLNRAGFDVVTLREEPPGGVLWALRR